MGKYLIIASTIIFLMIFWGVYYLGQYSIQEEKKNNSPYSIFDTQEECELVSGGLGCLFQTCDYVPYGESLETVCGADFKKGWIPSLD